MKKIVLILSLVSLSVVVFLKKEDIGRALNLPTKQNLSVGKNPPNKVMVKKYVAKITGYTLSLDETDDRPWEGARSRDLRIDLVRGNNVVASPDEPIGTKIKIGDKVYTVLDRMHPRYEKTGNLDILFHTKKEAFRFGIQYQRVEVYYGDTPQ